MSIITELSNRPGVNKEVVQHRLMTLDESIKKFTLVLIARTDAKRYKWNTATLNAIEEGIMAIMGGGE